MDIIHPMIHDMECLEEILVSIFILVEQDDCGPGAVVDAKA